MVKAIRALIQLCLLLCVAGTNAQTGDRNTTLSNTEKIDQYLEHSSKEFGFNGVVLIARKGEVFLNKGYGWKDVKGNMRNDSSTIFQIGSITKQFTAAIIMKLQEQGRLSVSDPVRKFIAGYPHGDKITLYHLLTHSSGIGEYTKSFQPYKLLLKKTVSKQKVLNSFRDEPLLFEPGTAFRYNSSNYYLLGIIIEKVTGKPYEHIVCKTIFDPLAMTNSGFDFRNLQDPHKATGYSVFYKGRQTKAADLDSTVLYSAGGIYSTAGDLYKWIKAVSNQEILTHGSWKQTLTPNKGNYGFGWAIDSLYGRRYLTHSGVTTNFSSLLLYFPDEDLSIILLNNKAGNLWNSGVDISRIIFDQPYPWGDKPAIELDSVLLHQYTGQYDYDQNHSLFVSVKDGQLQLNGTRNTGISNAPFVSFSETQFYNERLYLKIEFVKDRNGKVTALKGIRNGWYLSWTKVN